MKLAEGKTKIIGVHTISLEGDLVKGPSLRASFTLVREDGPIGTMEVLDWSDEVVTKFKELLVAMENDALSAVFETPETAKETKQEEQEGPPQF